MARTGTADRREEPESDYRVLVSVGNPAHVDQLMRTAVDLADQRDGEVLVLSAIVKPHESPFAVLRDDVIVREYGGERAAILDRAVEAAGDRVPVAGEVRVSTDLARTILQTARDHDCDAILLGWQERARTDFVFGTNVDRVVARAPHDVLVEKIGPTANGVESILLPVADSPHAALAARVAEAIAMANDAQVRALRVVEESADRNAQRAAEDLLERTVTSLEVPAEGTIAEAAVVAETIIERSADHDVTVLGASRQGPLRRFVVGTTPRRVSRDARSTVIMAKRGSEESSAGRLLARLRW